jgi:hypothetical protein
MYTGYDPRLGGEPIDPSGGGYDPSAYYHQSPGGRFRGDTNNWLDYLVGVERGTAGGNPDYEVPAWAERLPGMYGRFARWHESNVRNGGTGNAPDRPDPSLYLYSGPGARFGPPGGPLHGLLDQERPQPWDGPDGWPDPRDQGTPEPRRGGGGGGGQPNFSFQPYQGLNHRPSFVDWQPDAPLSEPTRYVYGQNTRQASPAPAPAPIGGRPGGGGGGGGRGPGRGAGGPGGGGRGTPGPAGPAQPRGGAPTQDDFFGWLSDMFGSSGSGPQEAGRGFRQGFGAGVDMNLLDKGTPGWMRDRTLNPNMAGHGTPETPIAPQSGQSFEDYLNSLSRQGYDTDTISSLLGPNGYQRQEDGSWTWGWGTGPVTRGESGYQFANDTGGGGGFSAFGPGPGNNRGQGGGLSLFDRRPGGEDGMRMQGGMGGLVDLLLGGQHFAR